jgi:hypothetical protein
MPNELKLEVLSHHLSTTATVDGHMHAAKLHCGHPGQIISARNCELVNAAIDVYYKSNTFEVTIQQTTQDHSVAMRYPPSVHAVRIRHIDIRAH